MDTTQRSAGVAGVAAAVCLAGLLAVLMVTRLDPQRALYPPEAMRMIYNAPKVWGAIGIVGAVIPGLTMVFALGLFSRLRGEAPTQASVMLCFAVVGLGAFALSSLMLWQGGSQLAEHYSLRSETGARYAWLALHAVNGGLNAFGYAFAGASLLVAGWALIATGLLNPVVGWAAVAAGILNIVSLFAPNSFPVFQANIVGSIIWLAWAGIELRKPEQE